MRKNSEGIEIEYRTFPRGPVQLDIYEYAMDTWDLMKKTEQQDISWNRFIDLLCGLYQAEIKQYK